jgi:long-chain acyl-CoA synthetase
MAEVGDVIGGVTVVTEKGRPGEGDEGDVGPIYRALGSKDGFPTLSGVKTLYESFEQSVKKNGDKPALGWRPMTDGKAGAYEWMTYNQAHEKIKAVGSAMLASGLKPKSRAGIFSGNTVEWMLAMQAGNYYSVYVVPIYDSLGENAVEYIVNHAGIELVFVDVSKIHEYTKVLSKIKQKTTRLCTGAPVSQRRRTQKRSRTQASRCTALQTSRGSGVTTQRSRCRPARRIRAPSCTPAAQPGARKALR